MTDIALTWDAGAIDAALDGRDLATDDGLRTAILVSIFSDARARDGDEVPDGADRRGWWGDALAEVPGDAIGSRLWLLDRSKRLPSVLAAARDHATEALAWLTADGIAASVEVEAAAVGDALAIGVLVTRPGAPARQRYDFLWEASGAVS